MPIQSFDCVPGHRIGEAQALSTYNYLIWPIGKDYCVTVLDYCVFSGEDCTSSFKGKVKVRPPKKLERDPRFHKTLREIGDDWNVKSRVIKQLEQFTYLVYGHTSKSSVNAVHVKLPHKMVGEDKKLISKSRVSPSLYMYQSAFDPHIEHVNHRVVLYK